VKKEAAPSVVPVVKAKEDTKIIPAKSKPKPKPPAPQPAPKKPVPAKKKIEKKAEPQKNQTLVQQEVDFSEKAKILEQEALKKKKMEL